MKALPFVLLASLMQNNGATLTDQPENKELGVQGEIEDLVQQLKAFADNNIEAVRHLAAAHYLDLFHAYHRDVSRGISSNCPLSGNAVEQAIKAIEKVSKNDP